MRGNSRIWKICLSTLATLCLVLAMLILGGCNNQPEVTSAEALDLIRQAYTACNTQNDQRLSDTQAKYDELVAAGTLSESEQKAFKEILELARNGEWKKAQDRAFSFAQSQVR
jgi:hypothetical protein